MQMQAQGGESVRQTPLSTTCASQGHEQSPSASAAGLKILLTDEEGAAALGVGLRTFLELQKEPWFPRPVVLGPRLKRHVRAELEAAVTTMPRGERAPMPPQLLRAKIEKMKRDGVPA